MRAGLNRSGIGLRVDVDWLSPTRVTGPTLDDDVHFAGHLVINARLFGNLGRMIPHGQSWASGMRLSLDLRNLLNRRPSVRRGGDGGTPLAYQAAYLEPLGRSVRLSLRRQF